MRYASDRHPLLGVLAILVLGALITWAIVYSFRSEEVATRETLFQARAQRWTDSVRQTLDNNLQALRAVAGMIHAVEQVQPAEFASFTHDALSGATALRAVEWIPVVSDADRTAFEAAQDGRRITERNANGALQPAASRARYYPVALIEPLRGNQQALGYDLGSDPTRLAALAASTATGRMQASAPIHLVQDPDGPPGMLIFLPVYRGEPDPAGREGQLRGFVLGVMVPQHLLDHAGILAAAPGMEVALTDVTSRFAAQPVGRLRDAGSGKDRDDATDLAESTDLALGARTIRLGIAATPAFAGELARATRAMLAALVATITLAAAIGWWWRQRTYHRLERLVRSLEKANAELADRDRDLAIFHTVIDQAPVGVCITGSDRKLTYANPAFLVQTGRRGEAWLGQDPFAAFPSADLERRIADGSAWTGEVTEHGADGSQQVFDVIVAPLAAGDGSHPHRVGFRRDITAMKQAESEARKRNEELLLADKMASLGTLAAGIAHEINTPIQFIGDNLHFIGDSFTDRNRAMTAYQRCVEVIVAGGGSASALADLKRELDEVDLEFLDSEIPKAIEQSLEGVQRVASIVRAMKDFSHPEAEVRTPIDINQAIQTTLIVARNEYKYVADVKLELAADLPQIPCFTGTIQQVILNLLVNASHAIADVIKTKADGGRGTITLRTRRDGDSAVIEVADTGSGIPARIRSRIFEPFFTTKPPGKGTGQGLNLSRQIVVQRHGGALSFTSVEGEGTTFTIRLPLEAGHA